MIDELRAARRSIGWSRAMLAKQLDADVQVVKRLEAGVGSVATLLAAMDATGFQMAGIGPGRTLTEQVRARREKRSWSIAEVARRAGMSPTTVASVEAGHGTVRSLCRILEVVAPCARRKAPERAYWGPGEKHDRDSRFTPPEFMEPIYEAFGEIDLDPCAHRQSPVIAATKIVLGEGGDGLRDDWSGRLAFVNPPFSAQLDWLKRAHAQWQAGNVTTVVCLVPVRTDNAFFQETLSRSADIYMLKGRVRFIDMAGRRQHTPFALMIVALGATAEQSMKLEALLPGFWMRRAKNFA